MNILLYLFILHSYTCVHVVSPAIALSLSALLLLVTAVQLKRLPRRSALLCIIVVATCIDGKNLILHCCKMVVVEKIEKAGGAFCWVGGGYACDWYLS